MPRTPSAYSFDAEGLPRSITEDGAHRDLVLLGSTLAAGTDVYTFDSLGRTVSRGDLTFTYGPDGHLASANRGGTVWQFIHDEDGQRLLKRVNSTPVAAYLEGGAWLDGTGLTEPLRVRGSSPV